MRNVEKMKINFTNRLLRGGKEAEVVANINLIKKKHAAEMSINDNEAQKREATINY